MLLIDREVGITLKRIYRNVPWWQRLTLISGLLASVLSREEIPEEEIERLKEGDVLESAFTQFAEREKHLYQPLIAERDRYMAARILEEFALAEHRHVDSLGAALEVLEDRARLDVWTLGGSHRSTGTLIN